jgi:release factor glutamine methyltransferase
MSTHSTAFGPVRVEYDERVLAPRRWTLVQSAHAARRICGSPPGAIVELHCGAGHIGQAAAAWTGRPLVQVDDDPACCTWAARNAAANVVPAAVVCSDVGSVPLRDERCALVLADPPYVPTVDTRQFPEDPRHAIDGGADGLDGIRACLPVASRLLRPSGAIVLQVRGPAQAALVRRLVAEGHPELTVVDVVTVSPTRAVVELVRG